MRLFGIAGWSGSGKTTLMTRLIPELRRRDLSVATIKHAHHSFDIDQPGKDSYRHREAGAQEVLISSSRRWVVIHEHAAEEEPSLAELIEKLSPADIVLVEGWKRAPYPKLEVFRPAVGKPPLWPDDPSVVAVASDAFLPDLTCDFVALDDITAIADLVLDRAGPADDAVRSAS